MVTQFRCQNEPRLQQVRTSKGAQGEYLNGIDYLEIGSSGTILVLHLIRNLSASLTQENVVLEGGDLTVDIESVSYDANLVTIKVKSIGDRSNYRLRLVDSLENLVRQGFSNLNEPPSPPGFDPQLSQINFSWQEKVSEFDCQPVEPLPEKPEPPPNIDYLAKDYASFRQLMLDRLAVTIPEWKERNPSDLGIMLVELLAYAADNLSYYQDAVATEAYLGTARKRISVRRHSRLLDYFMHDGCNARVWVTVQTSSTGDGVKLPGANPENDYRGTQLLTRVPTLQPGVLNSNQLIEALNLGTQVFETMHDLILYQACNKIQFYTWGNEEFELPQGATKATLKDNGGKLPQCLKAGVVVILLEQRNPATGRAENLDLTHRHAVRLTKVTPDEDPLFIEDSPEGKDKGQPQRVLEIEWAPEDALPFSLPVAKVIDGQSYLDLSVVKGNVVLADYGRTIPDVPLPEPQQNISDPKEDLINNDYKILDPKKLNLIPEDRDRYRPRLKQGVLTQQGYVLDSNQKWVQFDPKESASAAFLWEMRDTQPAMLLREYNRGQKFNWQFQRDLLNSDRFARDFVVETEDDGSAYLRFGDNVLGKKPEAGTYFEVTHRLGNGIAGNVGAESIAYLVTDNSELMLAIDQVNNPVSNPLPAQGGIEPEPIEQVRLYAPQAFRQQERAVTTEDYAQAAERHPEVQRAVAVRRWTGSWYTIFISIDRKQGLPIDDAFKEKLLNFLERFRLAGHELAIEAPQFVSLDLALKVQVKPDHFRSAVKGALLKAFSNRVLSNGQLGKFHPDRLTYGTPVYLSQLLQTAVEIDGVSAVEFIRFRRLDQPLQEYLTIGQIPIDAREIARLDNNPANPEQGRIEFKMEGGL